jgi:acetyl-CoA carboxylase carboxyltransferase component
LAGTLEIVARQAAAARGQEFDEESAAAMRYMVEQQIEKESAALYLSGRLYDDGVIDPRDTRTVLGLALSTVHNGPVRCRAACRSGTRQAIDGAGFGVFRV